MATGVTRALVVLQFGPLATGKARVGKELGRSLLVGILNGLAVQALRHIDRRPGLPAVQDCKGFLAKLPQLGTCRYDGWLAIHEELREFRKSGRMS